MGLLLQKILRITHAGSHKYDKVQDMYKRKVILCGGNGSNKKFSVKVPRLGPPRSILEPVMRQSWAYSLHTAENGLVAFLQFD